MGGTGAAGGLIIGGGVGAGGGGEGILGGVGISVRLESGVLAKDPGMD